MNAVALGLEAAASLLEERRDFSIQRQAIIAASAELQERELIKLASQSAAIAETLRRRGVMDPAASLSAEAGIAVFRTAFERWIEPTNDRSFAQLIRESLDQLKALTAGEQPPAAVRKRAGADLDSTPKLVRTGHGRSRERAEDGGSEVPAERR
jgi:hypothetical protein